MQSRHPKQRKSMKYRRDRLQRVATKERMQAHPDRSTGARHNRRVANQNRSGFHLRRKLSSLFCLVNRTFDVQNVLLPCRMLSRLRCTDFWCFPDGTSSYGACSIGYAVPAMRPVACMFLIRPGEDPTTDAKLANLLRGVWPS